ncbi:MAG: TetR/AcrR family transcriptional regulator [Candidatus Hydrogenedentes bacterium]|nr:TetR/AcrR family transcriptional regulator [Candidatus Hydrogenedentota bacterium]
MTRKQRELIEREDLILQAAHDLLLERGYHGLTMERIAKAIEYSKGTIYQHFRCKEEVISALASRYLEKQLAMTERAASYEGRTRERIAAIGEGLEIFIRLHPDEVRILQIIKSETVSEKASEECQAAMKAVEFQAMATVAAIVHAAVLDGDLELAPDTPPEAVSFGLWAIVSGGHANILRDLPFQEVRIGDPYAVTMNTCDILLDGYGWRPLSTEWDYARTRERARWTLFAKEARRLCGEECPVRAAEAR